MATTYRTLALAAGLWCVLAFGAPPPPVSISGSQVWTNSAGVITQTTNATVALTAPLMLYSETNTSQFLGVNAGNGAIDATESVFMGDSAGLQAEEATESVFLGQNAGYQATNAYDGAFVGAFSGYGAFDAHDATFLGIDAGKTAEEALQSTFVGAEAGNKATNSSASVFVGFNSGFGMFNAYNSVFIGRNSGTNRAQTLWIDTLASQPNGAYRPLIYGEFDNRLLTINGSLQVTNSLTVGAGIFDSSGPANGSIAISGASGQIVYTNLPAIYTGNTNIGNLATSLTIAINHTMPSTNYTPSVSFMGSALAAAVAPSYSARTPTNFVLNLSAGISGGDNLSWSVLYNP